MENTISKLTLLKMFIVRQFHEEWQKRKKEWKKKINIFRDSFYEMSECYQTTQMEAFFWNVLRSINTSMLFTGASFLLIWRRYSPISLQCPICNCAGASNLFEVLCYLPA